MKKPNIILLFLMVLTCWVGCHKDNDPDAQGPEVTDVKVTPKQTGASFIWSVVMPGKFQTGVEVSEHENMSTPLSLEAYENDGQFVANIDSLSPNTTYYYRIVVWNKFKRFEFEKDGTGFTTLETPPTPGQDTIYYDITVSVNLLESGTVTGGGTFAEGDTCRVVATANVGFNFVNWTENDEQISTEPEYSFTVTGNRTLVANFTSQEYTITATADSENGGTVSGSGGYNHGDECTLTAMANEGYEFVKWTKNGTVVSTNTVYTFMVTETATYVAHFQIQSYTIAVAANPENGGAVEGSGTYEYGQTCTVRATEANGYHFVNWTENDGQVSSNTEYTFTVTGDRDLVANFSAEDYVIIVEIDPEAGGTVTGAGGYNYGDECRLKATPNVGFEFVNWTKDGTEVSTDSVYTFTVIETATYVAHFQPKSYTISVSANPVNGGSACVGSTPGVTQGSFYSGQYCALHATPSSGYRFINWTENDVVISTSADYAFTVTCDRTLVANFEIQPQQYLISVSSNPTNGGVVTGGGYYQLDSSCTVTATANPNYTFVNWMEGPQVVSTNAEYTFTVTCDRTLVAHFEETPETYTINVSAEPTNGGAPYVGSTPGTTSGTYSYGQPCTVHANPNSGYTFTGWKENGTVVSTQANYTFTVTGNRSLAANFNYNGGGTVPQGAIDGKFTINDNGDKVYFSQGNLQYIGSASTPYWKFADHQWEYLGTTTGQNSTSQTVDRDLFGWGTSGWSGSGATYYRPWDTDCSNGSLYGPPGQYDLTGTYANADWGIYNPVNNGGNQSNLWRTLTDAEWAYVLTLRNTNSGIRYARAQVNNVNGVILLPDNWNSNYYSLNQTNQSGSSFSSNTLTVSQWTILEQAGAVFLPAAGSRNWTIFGEGSSGYYWSVCSYGNSLGHSIVFAESYLNIFYGVDRYYGNSVRLVCPAEN